VNKKNLIQRPDDMHQKKNYLECGKTLILLAGKLIPNVKLTGGLTAESDKTYE